MAMPTVPEMTSRPAHRRLGRPRATSAGSGLSPRDEIIAAAIPLFAERGVTQVTMSEIAAQVGLRHPSLYYWFSSKEAILAEIAERLNRRPLELIQTVEDPGEPAVELWRLICFDVAALCAFPLDINEVHRASRDAPEVFELYSQQRQDLIDTIQRLVAQGITAGAFRPVNAHLAALVVLSDDEGVQNWYRRGGGSADIPVDEIAEYLADQTVRGLLANPGDLPFVRYNARR